MIVDGMFRINEAWLTKNINKPDLYDFNFNHDEWLKRCTLNNWGFVSAAKNDGLFVFQLGVVSQRGRISERKLC